MKMYKRPLSKQVFIDNINKTVMMVEQVPLLPHQVAEKRKKKNKDSSENLHEAPESHIWVENLIRWPKDEKK